ncbi:hypothetical protein LTR37_016262 [Vermiconidia calcicola]|uniref:Uncharacterized protein n=1 Tax=Vermiconidia calcicola TaxID=1690605 RepID=A0ACC3MNG4_9PEZI|nr:hypothetical protein LTR37_016262 [Vermiconidia calcicola]
MEPVFGLELTMSGAVCAVSLPDGRIETLASINGSDQYVHLMHEWYDFYHATAEPGEIRVIVEDKYSKPEKKETGYISERWEFWLDGRYLSWKEQLEYWLGWKQRDFSELYSLDFYPTDEPTAILSSIIGQLRDAAFRALRNDTAQNMPERPFVNIALPGWFFARLPVFENDGYPDVREEMMIHWSHMFALAWKLSGRTVRNGALLATPWEANTAYSRCHQLGNIRTYRFHRVVDRDSQREDFRRSRMGILERPKYHRPRGSARRNEQQASKGFGERKDPTAGQG